MKVEFKENVLKVVTDITKETIEKGIASLVAKDDKGNDVYAVGMGEKACISDFALTCNTVVDGKIAAVMVLPMDTTQEDVMKQYGEKLLTAKKYTTQMAEEMEAKEAEIAEVFEAEAEAPENE